MVYQKLAQFSINNTVPVAVYQSTNSKLRVVVASVKGPMVRAHISFVTEAFTDDGLPHTLEHLVFMGSQKYPYKGFLDIIANRCLASGTNASTDQDHTAYTLSTAGSQGFLKVLPVYLDHLLSPMLTDSQYITEVHHIDGEGNDSGVVYSEMQDHESEMERLVDQKRKDLFYPPGSSYAANTGGKLAALRQSCSPEKVRQYHKDFYHLSNMCITVSGMVDHDRLLSVIEPVEASNLARIPANFARPFQTRLTGIEPKSERILCPSDDESIGLVELSWQGPPAAENYTIQALLILSIYLTDTAGAPLKRDFVQLDDPYCTSVHISTMEQTDCELIATFESVPVDKLDKIKARFFEKTIADHAESKAFDMERIGFILEQQSRNFLSKLENNAHSLVKDAVVGSQLYGSEGEAGCAELREKLDELTTLNRLKQEPAAFWHSLLHKFFTHKCVCVMGEPSKEAVDETTNKEEERIQKQIDELGEHGLEAMKHRLEQAIEQNTRDKPPAEALQELIVRQYENFSLIPVEVPTAGPKFIGDSPPFPTIVHKVPSDFIEATVLIDSHGLAQDDRQYLMLWADLMSQSPAQIDGQTVSYEEVAKLSTKDLVSNAVSVGISGVYDRFIALKLRVDVDNFDKLAKWAEIYLQNIVFDPKRVLICAKKLANRAVDGKRDGDTVAHFLNVASTYMPNSNTHLFNYLTTEKFHRGIARAVEKHPAEVIERLEKLRAHVLSSQLNVHFAGDPDKISAEKADQEKQRWQFLRNDALREQLQCPPEYAQKWDLLGNTQMIAVGGSESAFLIQKSRVDSDWNADGTMQTLLLAQYMSQCEGPLWCAIRGTGLAYDASIYLLPDRKTITLSLYRCSQLHSAHEKTKQTVLAILDAGKLDESQFEAAKRSLVCELVGGQSNVKLTGTAALLSTFRGVGLDFTQQLCARVWDAQMDNVLEKGAPTLRQLLDPRTSVISIAAHPSRVEEIKKNFSGASLVKIDDFQISPPKY